MRHLGKILAATALALTVAATAQSLPSDITGTYAVPKTGYDYVKRVEMVPMRDGTKLYTVIVIPKGARNAPIILTRTPYNAKKRAERSDSPTMLGVLPQGDELFVSVPDGRGFAARCPIAVPASGLDELCRVTFRHRGMDVNIRFPRAIIADWELMLGGVRRAVDRLVR